MKKILIPFFLLIICQANAQTQRELDNLESLNRLYGYIRYFHPSDEAAAIDWERFLTYGAREVEKCKSQQELEAKLTELFQPIAPTVLITGKPEKTTFSRKLLVPGDTSSLKIVSWQHNGLGIGSQGPYKSSRLNRKVTVKDGSGFGTISMSLDANAHKKKEFKYTALVKVLDGTGTGHLWVRVDRDNKQMGFFDNMESRPITRGELKSYEISGTIDTDANRLSFGCFLKGSGRLIVDELRVSVREGSEWKQIYGNGFELDNAGEKPGEMTSGGPGYKMLVTDQSVPEGKKAATIESVSNEMDFGLLFPRYCNVGEYVSKDIGSGLTAVVPLALYGDASSTYPKADPANLTSLNHALTEVTVSPEKDKYARLASLMITWNVFQHFYPYFDVVNTDWKIVFQPAAKEVYGNTSPFDFLKTLRKMTAQVKDGHVRVSGPASRDNEDYAAPIQWEWVENKLIITKVLDNSLQLSAGDVVGTIDDQAPEDYFAKVQGYISAATPGWLFYRANNETLFGPKNSKLKLTFPDDRGRHRPVEIARTLDVNAFYSRTRENPSEPVRQVGENVYYININDAPMSMINERMPDLVKAKAIICDLRGYPNSNYDLIGHLLEKNDTSARWMRIPQIIYPDQQNIVAYQNHGWSMKPLDPHLTAKVYFIVDGRAISYAESYMGFIEHYNLATIIGQPSAGTNGNVNFIHLPGGYRVTWTGMKVVKHDGSTLHGVGITPDIYVQKTIAGVREGRDEFLERAIELANQYQVKKND